MRKMRLTSKRRLFWNHSLAGLALVLVGMLLPSLLSCHGQIDPLTLGRPDPHCWESSSALLLKMKKPRIADTVSDFWDFMIFLKSSDESKHASLFWVLAQLFWDIYVDCMISRTHGLGRRRFIEEGKELENTHSISARTFVADQSTNSRMVKDFVQDWVGIQVYRSGSSIKQNRIAKNMGLKGA